MISEKLFSQLNEQVNFEFYSSYTYLGMAAYAESIDLSGFANFFRVQAQEELFHAMKLYDYIFQKNGMVKLEEIAKPENDYENILDAFQRGYNHEQVVTSRFYELADTANEEREHATISFLKWFIDEQVEEENTFNSLLKKVRRCEGNTAALYMLDEELSTRVFTPPTNA
ncbi:MULTISPECIES: ferritin [Romboutsia]|uniref:Ferritin n=1 Tax=Romboutsia hominis TaxID=1507512 RepID=A0A2P2BUX2_9FIRM|nr:MULTISPECIES: ferritin [Romboutsia]MCH1959014.1 ferritin [Romboutsia hominis]MCH1968138.1 ferritin [Romboutsia hominis]MDB8789791.1 ferritin [Romboutsia sp. 1001216sp1]MDB8794216.1 ferritin [Romboutsia sp. 1001216sp1]MDB8797245.1 ferritin [Romboutsia sp. 1001216sp1]